MVVNNAAGLTLASDATSATSLTLTAGMINTGSYKWIHTNISGNSLSTSGTSYVTGILRRYVAASGTDTYSFPVGTDRQYARLDLLNKGLVGTAYLDASFGPKTDPDVGLSCADTSPSALRYVAVHSAGRWLLTPDAQPTGGIYAVRAYLDSFSGLTDNLFAVLKRPDASTSAADWTTGGGTLSPDNGAGRRVADGYALRNGLNTFSQFGLGRAEASTPLPVTLVAFRAVAQGATARLSWVVAQEAGISYYEVERSLDGRTFQLIGQVMAKGGASLTYTYADALGQLVSSQPVYYRLRIVEPGQPATYSPVAALRYSAAADAALVAWPTVFAADLHLDGTALPEDLQRVELLDVQGRIVYTQTLPTGHRVASLSGQGLAAGLYLLRVATATQLYQQRVVRE